MSVCSEHTAAHVRIRRALSPQERGDLELGVPRVNNVVLLQPVSLVLTDGQVGPPRIFAGRTARIPRCSTEPYSAAGSPILIEPYGAVLVRAQSTYV